MTRNLPTQITAEYRKAYGYNKTKVKDAIWEYHIDCRKFEVSGFAGGLLTRNADGLWIAHYWDHCQGEPAETREQAILNVLHLAAVVKDVFEAEQMEYKRVYEERNRQARELGAIFPPESGLVIVHDTTAEYLRHSPEARYKVTMTFDNLMYDQVCELAAAQQRKKGII